MTVGELVQENSATGLRAVFVGGEYITIFNSKNVSIRATTLKNADMMMHRYGRSKVLHWNDCCAKPNTQQQSTKIRMLDGLLEGCSVCLNCFGRTKFYHN